jgi:hypothetical protein
VPTPIVAEQFFSVPAIVTPIIQGNVVVQPIVDSPMPIVGSPMAEIDDEEELVFQEPIVNHKEQQQPPI